MGHPVAYAQKKPHRDNISFDSANTQHSPQMSMKQSQILPAPPHSPERLKPRTLPRQERTSSRVHFDFHMSISQHTCLNHSTAMSESGLWTLPGFDDDENEPGIKTKQPQRNPSNRWARMLQSAASSNRQRHRVHLEREGWAFVGGRYSDDMQELSDESGGSVDEEFDVVVLPRESVGC